MIQPNFNLLLWAILIINTLLGVLYVIAGAAGLEKTYREKYGIIDIINGFIYIIIGIVVMLT